MEFFLTDADKMEEKFIKNYLSLDIEINSLGITASDKKNGEDQSSGGDTANTFELVFESNDPQDDIFHKWIFSPGSEFGGIIEDITTSTTSNIVKARGSTFRGLLNKDIVRLPEGQSFLIVGGDPGSVITSVLSAGEGAACEFEVVSDTESEIQAIPTRKVKPYVSKLYAIEEVLGLNGYKLKVWAEQGAANEPFRIVCGAFPIPDESQQIEYSQDTIGEVTIVDDRSGINHLIVRYSIGTEGGEVVKEFYFDDIKPDSAKMRSAVYDCGNVEDGTVLAYKVLEKFMSLGSSEKASINDIENYERDLQDMIIVRDTESKLLINQPVIGKILKGGESGKFNITLKVKGN